MTATSCGGRCSGWSATVSGSATPRSRSTTRRPLRQRPGRLRGCPRLAARGCGSGPVGGGERLTHHTGFMTGARGRRIFWQAWEPATSPRAVVVIVHGASEHSDRYRYVVAALVTDGYAVYALDHRGHG